MTIRNLHEIATAQLVGTTYNSLLPGWCVAASLDCMFEQVSVPWSIYEQCDRSITPNSSDEEVDAVYDAIKREVFHGAQNGEGIPYYFPDFASFASDAEDFRSKGNIMLLSTQNQAHAVGMKAARKPHQWLVGGLDQRGLTRHIENGVHIVGLVVTLPRKTRTAEQIWRMLECENKQTGLPYHALVFPPEPQA